MPMIKDKPPLWHYLTGALILVFIFLAFFVLLRYDPFGWFANPAQKTVFYGNAMIGFAASAIASVVVITVYSIRAERDLAEYVADIASQKAVAEVLKLLTMVPEQVFDASIESDKRFEEQFEKDFAASQYFHFFSASARNCSKRLSSLSQQDRLDEKSVLIFVLDPSQREYLEAHARKRIAMQSNNQRHAISSLDQEVREIQKEIFRAIVRLYDVAKLNNVDLRFHTSFVFFRSEIFDTGFFLTFQRGTMPFPGSVYYSRSSPVYEAYRCHFEHHIEDSARNKFSLKVQARSNVPLEQILQDLKCPWKLPDLQDEQIVNQGN